MMISCRRAPSKPHYHNHQHRLDLRALGRAARSMQQVPRPRGCSRLQKRPRLSPAVCSQTRAQISISSTACQAVRTGVCNTTITHMLARISTAEARSAANLPATRMALLSASKSSLEATSASLDALDAAIAEAKSLRTSHAADPRSSADSISCRGLFVRTCGLMSSSAKVESATGSAAKSRNCMLIGYWHVIFTN